MGFNPLNSGDYHKFESTTQNSNHSSNCDNNRGKGKTRLVIDWGYAIKFIIIISIICIVVEVLTIQGRY